MNEFKIYLQERIDQLTKLHASFLQLSKDHSGNETISLGYNTKAASVWDQKCEVEAISREFDECCKRLNLIL